MEENKVETIVGNKDNSTETQTIEEKDKTKDDIYINEEIEAKKYSLDLVNQWINNADTKISIAFAVISVIFTGFGAFFSFSLKEYNWDQITSLMLSILIFMCLGIMSFFVSLVFFGIALFPNFVGKQCDEKKYNLLLYMDVSRYGKDDIDKYRNNFKKYSNKRFLTDIESEIFFNSRVCKKKMIFFRLGIVTTGVFTILFITCFIMTMFII